MLDRFAQLSLLYQLGILLGMAVALSAGVEYLDADYVGYPGLNPLVFARQEQVRLQTEHKDLKRRAEDVANFERELADWRVKLEEANATEAVLRVQVPGEKKTGEFLASLEEQALDAQVSVRELISQPVVLKTFYAEITFQMALDGPYYNLSDYFKRLGSTERITNVASLTLQALEDTAAEYQYAPGASVTGTVQVTTYYIPSQEELDASAPPTGAAGQRR